jgi:hypothetical protein
MNVERNVIDRANFMAAAELSTQQRFPLRINLGQISDFDQRHG